MFLLNLYGMSAIFFNDILAMLSAVGGLLLLIGSFSPNKVSSWLISLGEWSLAPLIFGSLFQICFFISGLASETENIGFVLPMPVGVVNGLFTVSIFSLIARWCRRKNPSMAAH